MKKEVFLAISIGFALGLIITFGIWTANRSLKNARLAASPTPSPTAIPLSTPTTPVTTNKLTIISPEDESLVNTPQITLTGKTDANTPVAITYEDIKQQIVTSDTSGNFKAVIDLVSGYNTINVTALGNTQTIIVTYSTAKI